MRNSIVIIIFLFGIAYSCTNDLKDVMALPKPKLSPDQEGDSVTVLYTDSARLRLMVKANRMLVFTKNVKEPFTVMSNGLFVTFFDEDEKISATLKADYGVRFDLTRRMEARHAVEVVNRKGEKLETEKLVWDEANERIYTDAFVKITTGKEVIMGHGMESNQDFSKYELRKVTGSFQLKNDEK